MEKIAQIAVLLSQLTGTDTGTNPTKGSFHLSCWIGGVGFSQGATARVSGDVMLCDKNAVWIITNKAASGCLHNGKIYSSGALKKITAEIVIACGDNGAWVEFK